jgi:O-antigen ligase
MENGELEVHMRPDSGKTVIEGKTVVPFQSFVTLVLQRKVLSLTKVWGKHPVIIDSELLTTMASAPQDNQENRSSMILVSIILGIVFGVATFSIIQIILLLIGITLAMKELAIIVASILGVIIIAALVMKMQKMPKGEKLVETVEGISSFLK